MSAMFRRGILFAIFLQVTQKVLVQSAQQVQLSDSYLPVAMQVIAHLTDQMAYEVRDVVPSRPTTTTPKPLYVPSDYYYGGEPSYGWWMRYGSARDITTQFHKPGLYAPPFPPKPTDKGNSKNQNFVLLPVDHNSEYTIIEPQEQKTEGPFLSDDDIEVRPLMEPRPNLQHQFLPYDDDIKVYRRSDGYEDEEGLQYLSQSVRDMIRMANDPDDDRLVDVWEGLRASPTEVSTKGKLSSSNLRLLLLYDLLSRDAKKQRLSDFTGFSPEVMKALVESSDGGARAQLAMALDRMVERHDCSHEYANNRAREMVAELARDESLLSSELRYLQPLIYRY